MKGRNRIYKFAFKRGQQNYHHLHNFLPLSAISYLRKSNENRYVDVCTTTSHQSIS